MHKSLGIDALFDSLKNPILRKMSELPKNLGITYKDDATPVTILDQFISDEVKRVFLATKEFKGYCFYSEEDYGELSFPALILDPLDGTKEFIRGLPEYAVSLAIMHTEDSGIPWVFNPSNHFEATLKTIAPKKRGGVLEGLVSHTELRDQLFQKENQKIKLTPMGSIAYKLAQLSHGKGDFVLSMRGKNLWDIAAGHLLATAAGFGLFQNGKRIETLTLEVYEPPLLWCRPEDNLTLRAWAKI